MQQAEQTQRAYLPAAGKNWALPFYDPVVKLIGGEAACRTLLDQAALEANHRVLEIGCGTGTVVAQIKRQYPTVDVVGLDPDPLALARARKKAARAGLPIRFDQGFADELPYPDASFDRVLSSFMFHHLDPAVREKTLREVRRVLKPVGSLHLVDFSPGNGKKQGGGNKHWFSAHAHVKDNSQSRILTLMRQSGFPNPKKVADRTMLFGLLHIAYYEAST